MIFYCRAVFISKKIRMYSVDFKTPHKIVASAFGINIKLELYNPHIIGAFGNSNPRLRSSLFYQ
jgi:hypothetical protein